MVGIVDEALSSDGEDALNIAPYKEALVDFIKRTDTPMTIGVQGEWGSGKTSLLNQIWNELDNSNKEDHTIPDFRQIWVNSWEHSLLCSPEEALLKIVNEIIQDLLAADSNKNRADKIASGVQSVMKGALRLGGSAAFGVTGASTIDDMFSENSNSIKQLRAELSILVREIRSLETNPFGKVVIYVDDLDRIEPRDAVKILELLKNIFNIKDCVFILAIDYQVVVKGLKEKFGEQTPENEWEFRAFFDKIIQLPFTMPMGNYDIGNYVIDLLTKIEFYSGDDELDDELIKQFVELSIGGNPRSIKRLINSLALIKIFNDKSKEHSDGDVLVDKDVASVMFAMVCLQIAYPEIYEMLPSEPIFTCWDDDYAYKITQKKEESDKSWEKNFKQATESKDFDETWEQCLFRVCYANPRYRTKAMHISKFLGLLNDEYDKEKIGDLILTALGRTAVTSVNTKEIVNIRPPKGSFKRHFNLGFDDWLLRIKADRKNLHDFPSNESKTLVKKYIDVLKAAPFNAKDFKPGEDSDYIIKYSGGITVYFKKRKIGGMYIGPSRNGDFIWWRISKHPKHDNKPLRLIKSGIYFQTPRMLKVTDLEKREYSGAYGFVDFMEAKIDPLNHNVSDGIISHLIKESADAKWNYKDKIISGKICANYLEDFKTKRKDSEEFLAAVDFIETYFDENNYQAIDL
jgi:hypothetical protein